MGSRTGRSRNVVDLREPRLDFTLDYAPLVPEGRYELSYCGHSYSRMYKGGNKLEIRFKILDMGEHFEAKVSRWYNVKKQGRNYRASGSMDLNREFIDLFDKKALRQGVPWELLEQRIVLGEVRTVKKGANQKVLSQNNQYSVIDRLIKVIQ